MSSAHRRRCLIAALCAALLLCAACAAQPVPTAAPASPETAADLSGTYTDCQGTDEVYSALALEKLQDGTYAATVQLYRLTTLEGIAEEGADGALRFDCEEPSVKGNIALKAGAAALTVEASSFPGIEPGAVYRFPDGGGQSADS